MRVLRNKRAATLYEQVAQEDQAALKRERRAGLHPVQVTEDGLVAEDVRYMAVLGGRDPSQPVVLWDPTTQDTVWIEKKGRKLRVLQGVVRVDVEFRLQHLPLEAAAVESVGNAYDEGREEISRWLLGTANNALRFVIEAYGPDAISPDWDQEFGSRKAMWKELRSRGVNPWPQ